MSSFGSPDSGSDALFMVFTLPSGSESSADDADAPPRLIIPPALTLASIGGRMHEHPEPAEPRHVFREGMTASAHTRRNLLFGVVLGLLALVAGVALAETFLPEWQAGEPPD